MPFKTNEIKVCSYDDRNWILEEDILYKGKSETFVVPKGFKTDFASVPAAVQWLIPSTGRYSQAAIVHDFFCDSLNRAHRRLTDREVPVTARDADAIFRRMMRELEVPPLRRYIIWTGVRWGALANPARRKDWWRDAPAVIGWSILSAPVVLPASILAVVGITIDRAAEAVVRFFGGR